MREIVINAKYGGFGLSYKAVMRYAELKGIKLYHYISETHKKIYGEKATVDNPEILVHYCTKAAENEEMLNEYYFSESDIERDDPILVQVVKELGEAANVCHAKLKIVEIPEDVKWEIDEYDGMETVREASRSWS
jgi:hypothetical protein